MHSHSSCQYALYVVSYRQVPDVTLIVQIYKEERMVQTTVPHYTTSFNYGDDFMSLDELLHIDALLFLFSVCDSRHNNFTNMMRQSFSYK